MDIASPTKIDNGSTITKYLAYNENADRLFRRMRINPLRTGLAVIDNEIPNGLRPGNVVEIFGSSGTGKTEFLLHILIQIILPKKWSDFEIGGEESGVIYFDNDLKFDLLRLISLIEQKLKKQFKKSNFTFPFEFEPFLKDCLQRLHILRCKDSMQFWCSLKSLPNLLEKLENITAVMIDSVSAFFWLDKYEEEYGKTMQRRIFKQLSVLLNDYNFILFATKSQIFQPKDRENPRDFMNPSWTELVQYKIHIWPVNICCWKHGFDNGDEEMRKEFCAKFISQSPKPPFKYVLTESGVLFI